MHDDNDCTGGCCSHGARSQGGSNEGDRTTPLDLKVKLAEQKIHIEWKDGKSSVYDLGALRKACPCATCREERDKKEETLFNVLKADPNTVKVVSAQLVGTYAITFEFSDGHKTGIYDFKYLRALDQG